MADRRDNDSPDSHEATIGAICRHYAAALLSGDEVAAEVAIREAIDAKLTTAQIDDEIIAPALWLVGESGAESGPAQSHEGEDIVIVLQGQLSVDVAGTSYELKAGDSICFNSELPHRWRNPGARVAQAIWISSPPYL